MRNYALTAKEQEVNVSVQSFLTLNNGVKPENVALQPNWKVKVLETKKQAESKNQQAPHLKRFRVFMMITRLQRQREVANCQEKS